MATTAVQTITRERRKEDASRPARPEEGSRFWDACYGLRKDGEFARASRTEQGRDVEKTARNLTQREPTPGEGA